MRRFAVVLCVATVASGLSASSVAAASSRALASALVQGNEMRGFGVVGRPARSTTPAAFVQRVYRVSGSGERHEIAALRAAGFVGGASEFLRARDGLGASQVWEFKDARSAVAYLRKAIVTATQLLPQGSTIRPLRLGVPDSRAFVAASGSARLTVSDAYMLVGRCMLFVGDELTIDRATASKGASTVVVAASRSVWGRAGSLCR